MIENSSFRQWLAASGYLCALIAPGLLITGVLSDRPLLAFGVVMVLYPLARPLFGEVGEAPVEWTESTSAALHRLPMGFAIIHIAMLLWLPLHLLRQPLATMGGWMSLGLSLWIVLLLATCVAHELIHRRAAPEARLGRWLAAVVGYPLLALEHINHHARVADVARAEWPAVAEPMWRFAARRLRLVTLHALHVARGRVGSQRARAALLEAIGVMLLVAGQFWAMLGVAGLALYLAVAASVTVGFQAITYLQHWGLAKGPPVLRGRALAWEDSCRFQAWVTLNVSCHQAHHTSSQTPYYRLAPEAGSPRQPAGYVILLVLSLVPALWFHLMHPVLDTWRRQPGRPMPTGRRLTCFHLLSQMR